MSRFDSDVLAQRLYPELKTWMQFCIDRARPSRPENEGLPAEIKDWLVETGTHWGEWCEPGITVSDYMEERAATGHAEIGTAFLSHGCELMAQIAQRLGYEQDAAYFREASCAAARAYRYVYLPKGKVESSRQCHYVRPVAMGLLEPEQIRPTMEALVEKLQRDGGIGTGFLSTCYLCDVLTDQGYAQVAYDLLLNTHQPSWLFEVERGATTIWESWFGIRPDGTRRGSHNHYAFGSVSGWLMSRVAGIRLENGEILIRPYPDRRLRFVEAEYRSPMGTIRSAWRYEGERLLVEVQIPTNGKATLTLPDGSCHVLAPGCHSFCV
jgi:alpha-L-rhamnosidase